ALRGGPQSVRRPPRIAPRAVEAAPPLPDADPQSRRGRREGRRPLPQHRIEAGRMTPPAPSAKDTPSEPHTPHHRVPLVEIGGGSGRAVTRPLAFSTPIRLDLIRRAVVAAQSHRRQPHGTSPTAGVRHSVQWSGKGKGVARTPRLMDSMRGAQSPNTVGGRPAHPPK